MKVAADRWAKNQDSVSVDRGPLTLLAEDRREVRPRRAAPTSGRPGRSIPPRPGTTGWCSTRHDPAVVVRGGRRSPGRRTTSRSRPTRPRSSFVAQGEEDPRLEARRPGAGRPDAARARSASDEPTETITLIPMGCARLRISAFPTIAAGTPKEATATAKLGPKFGKLSAVPFTEVKIQDEFWAPRIETNREKSLPHNFKWCEQTGRISNFAKAAGLMEGKFEGIYFNDSDVYKVLEGAAYSLADHPDPALEKMVDDVIAKIAAAQQEDGYLNTYYTLVEPDKKWTNLPRQARAVLRGPPDRGGRGPLSGHRQADAAGRGRQVRRPASTRSSARASATTCRATRRSSWPWSSSTRLTGEKRYLDLAQFFLDVARRQRVDRKLYGAYCQDHVPVREQSEIVGHAVRAMYLYSRRGRRGRLHRRPGA